MQYKTLIAGSLFSGAAFAATGALGDAEPILDNPTDVGYLASFLGDTVRGSVVGRAPSSGKGVEFTVELKITPGAGQTGAYGYHIHDAPVPADGNCTGTLAHLDPYQRGAATPCDPLAPETCEVGDLAGKHGKIGVANSTAPVTFTASYLDLYASTQEGIGAFFGNRSIVIHAADKSRIACANFIPVYGDNYEDQVSTKPCSTGLVTKTLASTVTDGYATETISYETVETTTAYTVVPVSSAPVLSSSPCATSLITKTKGSSTYVETSMSYTMVPVASGSAPVPSGSVPSGSVPSGNVPYPSHPVSSGVPVPSGNGTNPAVPSGSAGSPSDGPGQTPVAPSTAPPAATNDNEVPGSAATFGISASLAVAAIFAGFATIW